MEFVENLAETVGLPVFVIGGVARAEVIDNCMVRITLLRVPDPGAADIPIAELQLVWSIPAWCSARAALQQVAEQIARCSLPLKLEASPHAALVKLNHH